MPQLPRRRWLRLALGALAIWVGGVVVTFSIIEQRVPVSLPLSGHVLQLDNGYVRAEGTWTIEGDDHAFPLQTTVIECWPERRECTAATAEVSSLKMLNIIVETFPVVEWTRTTLVFVNDSPLCVRYVYTINLATKSVTGFRARRDQPVSSPIIDCERLASELRLTMRSGFDVWRRLQDDATPWFGWVFLAPFKLLS